MLGGSLSYTDIEFRNITPTFLAAQGGEYLPSARPAWTGSAYASYETPPLDPAIEEALRDYVGRRKEALSG